MLFRSAVRLPLSWLRDFVDYSGSVEDLALRLGTSGFEIEGILRPGAPDEGDNHACFVVGRVAHFEQRLAQTRQAEWLTAAVLGLDDPVGERDQGVAGAETEIKKESEKIQA